MALSPPFSVLLIHAPPAKFVIPPLTMSQAKRMIANQTIKTHHWNAGPQGLPDGGDRLLDLLEDLSARFGTTHLMGLQEIEPTRLKDLVMVLYERQSELRLSLRSIVDRPMTSAFRAVENCGAIVQIQWRLTGSLPDLGFFKAFSRAGVWNHLLLDGAAATQGNCKAAALQPNIIHSWKTVNASKRGQDIDGTYGKVSPLPGRPLWQTLNDSLERFLLADRLTKERLWRLRIGEDGDRLYTVGSNLEYHFLTPDRLPDGYLDEICAMVAAGGTVAPTHVKFNLERAYLIGYVLEKGVIVGNSSLKHPRPEYIENVRHQSGLDLTGYVERGYTSVRPEYRGLGIGTQLLEGLTRRAGDRKIFSVIAEDNEATKVIAKRNHTRQVATYFSRKAGKPVGIWMPEWMIEDTQ